MNDKFRPAWSTPKDKRESSTVVPAPSRSELKRRETSKKMADALGREGLNTLAGTVIFKETDSMDYDLAREIMDGNPKSVMVADQSCRVGYPPLARGGRPVIYFLVNNDHLRLGHAIEGLPTKYPYPKSPLPTEFTLPSGRVADVVMQPVTELIF